MAIRRPAREGGLLPLVGVAASVDCRRVVVVFRTNDLPRGRFLMRLHPPWRSFESRSATAYSMQIAVASAATLTSLSSGHRRQRNPEIAIAGIASTGNGSSAMFNDVYVWVRGMRMPYPSQMPK